MQAIFKKEINQFFSSATGYISLLLFWIACALFLFVFPDTSLLSSGYATLDELFSLAPWIFLFIIPAITMRSLSDERRNGTMELLFTKPLTALQIISGKYFACLCLVIFALIPTLFYYVSVSHFAAANVTLDNGGIIGSYIGLILLAAVLTAIGIWSSSLTSNTVIAFLIALFLNFIFYNGFDAISKIPGFEGGADYYIQMIGISYHYNSISRGVADVKDIIYFLSVIIFFILLSRLSFSKLNKQ